MAARTPTLRRKPRPTPTRSGCMFPARSIHPPGTRRTWATTTTCARGAVSRVSTSRAARSRPAVIDRSPRVTSSNPAPRPGCLFFAAPGSRPCDNQRMRVLVADKFDAAGIEAMTVAGATVLCEPAAGASGLGVALARHAPEVLIVRSSTVAAEAIRSAPRLRGIVRAGAGVDNIDLDAATAAGVLVSNCPGMNAASVAELVLGLMIACDRRIVDQTSELRAGRWNKKEYGTRARGLKGSTLGVVGPGAIGQEVIRRAKAFEM